ncbi:MAG TPA: hypothetical protein VGI99_06320 [Gemmataceae bacterium]
MRGAAPTLSRIARPALVLALVFAQAVSAFGFPQIQTRWTVQACGCLTPCGRDTANCCCAKSRPAPEPIAEVKPRCAKCKKSSHEDCAAPTPKVKWVPGVKARQCRGDGPMGAFSQTPAIPPAAPLPTIPPAPFPEIVDLHDSSLVSHISSLDEPPPRIA